MRFTADSKIISFRSIYFVREDWIINNVVYLDNVFGKNI